MVKRGHRCTGLKHQKEKRSMDHFAGLDVSVKATSVCIVDDTGRIVREVKMASEPEALLPVLTNPAFHFKRIGLEAGPLSQWLFSALAEVGLPAICVETRHMRAVLKAQINKTDRNDARGIAQMMRVGLYRPVHVKTLRSQKLRMLLTHRKLLQSKAIAVDNGITESLREQDIFPEVDPLVDPPEDLINIPSTHLRSKAPHAKDGQLRYPSERSETGKHSQGNLW